MALLTFRPPVNYEEQQCKIRSTYVLSHRKLMTLAAAFEDFLKIFKSSGTSEAANALQDLNLDDEDGTSEEYDFMDDVEDNNAGRTRRREQRSRDPKTKYMDLLQDVADRKRPHITIDLDDVDMVWGQLVYPRTY